jgi:hypothetical protein
VPSLLERLWRALAQMHDPVDTRAGWERALVDDMPLVEPFLRPVRGAASTWPCGRSGSHGCERRVVRHRGGAVVAVCALEPPECDRVHLDRTALACVRLTSASLPRGCGRRA